MNRLAAVVEELQSSERLIKNALEVVGSVEVLRDAHKDNVTKLLHRAVEQLKATKVFVHACVHAEHHQERIAKSCD